MGAELSTQDLEISIAENELHDIFAALDKNNDGTLEHAEASEFFPAVVARGGVAKAQVPVATKLLTRYYATHKGKLAWADLLKATRFVAPEASPAQTARYILDPTQGWKEADVARPDDEPDEQRDSGDDTPVDGSDGEGEEDIEHVEENAARAAEGGALSGAEGRNRLAPNALATADGGHRRGRHKRTKSQELANEMLSPTSIKRSVSAAPGKRGNGPAPSAIAPATELLAPSKVHLQPFKKQGNVLTRSVRKLVSKKKFRFQKEGFDLDLSYITPNIIAMGFPSEGSEAAFRNPMDQVQHFFHRYHTGKFKIYNLCSERSYPHEKFTALGGRVAEYGFDDHNAPPINLLFRVLQDMHEFLSEDPEHCVAVHCKAGKGRTGTVIAGYLVYAQLPACTTATDALAFYGSKRTKNAKGVTIPSQGRYVEYAERYLRQCLMARPLPPVVERSMKLSHILVHTIPRVEGGGCTPYFQIFGPSPGNLLYYDYSTVTQGHMPGFYNEKRTPSIIFPLMIMLKGDVKFQFRDAGKDKDRLGNKGDKLFHFWLNPNFHNGKVRLEKEAVDKAAKDKRNKRYKKTFAVELFFDEPTEKEVHELERVIADKARLRRKAAARDRKQRQQQEDNDKMAINAVKPSAGFIDDDEISDQGA